MRASHTVRFLYAVFAIAAILSLSRPSAAGPININTASESQLDELPNIGPSRARAIIKYREEHGPFQKREDIMKVHGIGKGICEGLKDSITVGAAVEARGRAPDEAAPAVPPGLFKGKKCVPRGCWSCKNSFYVPDNLKKGWCPFCGKKWSIR